MPETWTGDPITDEDIAKRLKKPQRGQHVLDRDEKRAEVESKEEAAKKRAKVRDRGCRWPEKHECRGNLEGAHIFQDKGMGGDHGTVSDTWNLMALCAWMHRLGPVSIHGKQIKVEAETPAGADGPCSFYREDENKQWVCVGVETSIGILMKN